MAGGWPMPFLKRRLDSDDEAVAGVGRVAGLDPVCTGDHTRDRIVIGLRDVVVPHAPMTEITVVEARITRGQRFGQDRQIARAAVGLPLVGEPVGGAEMSVLHAQLGSMAVHQIEPGFL